MKNKSQDSNLNEVIRLNILNMINGNQFYLVDDNKQLYQDKEKRALLTDAEIIENINNGTFPTQKGIDGAKILIKDNELFRIVKILNPDNAKISEYSAPD